MNNEPNTQSLNNAIVTRSYETQTMLSNDATRSFDSLSNVNDNLAKSTSQRGFGNDIVTNTSTSNVVSRQPTKDVIFENANDTLNTPTSNKTLENDIVPSPYNTTDTGSDVVTKSFESSTLGNDFVTKPFDSTYVGNDILAKSPEIASRQENTTQSSSTNDSKVTIDMNSTFVITSGESKTIRNETNYIDPMFNGIVSTPSESTTRMNQVPFGNDIVFKLNDTDNTSTALFTTSNDLKSSMNDVDQTRSLANDVVTNAYNTETMINDMVTKDQTRSLANDVVTTAYDTNTMVYDMGTKGQTKSLANDVFTQSATSYITNVDKEQDPTTFKGIDTQYSSVAPELMPTFENRNDTGYISNNLSAKDIVPTDKVTTIPSYQTTTVDTSNVPATNIQTEVPSVVEEVVVNEKYVPQEMSVFDPNGTASVSEIGTAPVDHVLAKIEKEIIVLPATTGDVSSVSGTVSTSIPSNVVTDELMETNIAPDVMVEEPAGVVDDTVPFIPDPILPEPIEPINMPDIPLPIPSTYAPPDDTNFINTGTDKAQTIFVPDVNPLKPDQKDPAVSPGRINNVSFDTSKSRGNDFNFKNNSYSKCFVSVFTHINH